MRSAQRGPGVVCVEGLHVHMEVRHRLRRVHQGHPIEAATDVTVMTRAGVPVYLGTDGRGSARRSILPCGVLGQLSMRTKSDGTM